MSRNMTWAAKQKIRFAQFLQFWRSVSSHMLVEIPDLFFDDTVLGQPIFLSQVIISNWLVSPKQDVHSQYPDAETDFDWKKNFRRSAFVGFCKFVSERTNHSTQFNEHQIYTNSSCALKAHFPISSNNLLNDVSQNTFSNSTEDKIWNLSVPAMLRDWGFQQYHWLQNHWFALLIILIVYKFAQNWNVIAKPLLSDWRVFVNLSLTTHYFLRLLSLGCRLSSQSTHV